MDVGELLGFFSLWWINKKQSSFKQQFIFYAMINFQNCLQDSFCPIIYFLSGFPPSHFTLSCF